MIATRLLATPKFMRWVPQAAVHTELETLRRQLPLDSSAVAPMDAEDCLAGTVALLGVALIP
jgi:hypothetical protein